LIGLVTNWTSTECVGKGSVANEAKIILQEGDLR
jgi:hypothetical protein